MHEGHNHYLLFLARSVRHLADGTPWKYEGCTNERRWVLQHSHGPERWHWALGKSRSVNSPMGIDSGQKSGFGTAVRAAKALARQLRLRPNTIPAPYPGPFKLQERPITYHEDGGMKGGGYFVLDGDGRFVARVITENNEEEVFAKWLIMAMNVFGGYTPIKETSND